MKKLLTLTLFILVILSGCTNKKTATVNMLATKMEGKNDFPEALKGYVQLNLDDQPQQRMAEMKTADTLYYTLPMGDTVVTLALIKSENTTNIIYSGKQESGTDVVIQYHGKIVGHNISNAAITMTNGEPTGIIGDKDLGTFNIVKIENANKFLPSATIVYNEQDLKGTLPMHEDDQLQVPDEVKKMRDRMRAEIKQQVQKQSATVTKCVDLYWNVDYDIYLSKGAATASFIMSVFNEVQALNAISGIHVNLKVLKINNTEDAFTGLSTIDNLNQFWSYIQSATEDDGCDVKMLLGTKGGGGVAYVDAIGTAYSVGYAGITLSFNSVTTYSWTVEVITHEQGHIMGSQHTHACVWPVVIGGVLMLNQPIDGCGPSAGYGFEGSCTIASTDPRYKPAGGGTVMSYCHLTSVGINFALGFGDQPAQRILDNLQGEPSVGSCDTIIACPVPVQPGAITGTFSVATGSNQTYSIQAVPNTVSYMWSLPPGWTGSSTGTSINTVASATAGTGTIAVVAVNSCGVSPTRMTTVTVAGPPPTTCNKPTGMATSNVKSTSATLICSNAVTYNRFEFLLMKGVDTVSKTMSFSPVITLTGLTPNTSYKWQVRGYCVGVAAPSAWSTPYQPFTTAVVTDACSYSLGVDVQYVFTARPSPVGLYTFAWTKNRVPVSTSQIYSGIFVKGDTISLNVNISGCLTPKTFTKIIQ